MLKTKKKDDVINMHNLQNYYANIIALILIISIFELNMINRRAMLI